MCLNMRLRYSFLLTAFIFIGVLLVKAPQLCQGRRNAVSEKTQRIIAQIFELPLQKSGIVQIPDTANRFSTDQRDDEKLSEDDYFCGSPSLKGVGIRTIIEELDNNTAAFGEFPWMALITSEVTTDLVNSTSLYRCGGALIHPQVAITVAHCVMANNESYGVRLGEWNTQKTNEFVMHQERRVNKVILHPSFNFQKLRHDIALLILDKPAELRDFVNTVCVVPAMTSTINAGYHAKCTYTGWGKVSGASSARYATILKKVDLTLVPRNECQIMLRKTVLGSRFKLHESFLCAGGEKGKDACKGDGGSPLVCPIPESLGRYRLAGLVAWGIGCGDEDIPGIYVDVSLYTGWIERNFQEFNFSTRAHLHT